MTNFIKLEYFKCDTNADNLEWNEKDFENFNPNKYMQYINPNQIATLYPAKQKNNNGEEVLFTMITMSSGEGILTALTIKEILEKIDGKPKK